MKITTKKLVKITVKLIPAIFNGKQLNLPRLKIQKKKNKNRSRGKHQKKNQRFKNYQMKHTQNRITMTKWCWYIQLEGERIV